MVLAVPGVPAPPRRACSTTCCPLLERDLSYARFLLDGQTAVLDDYLEVRPEAADALRRLATSGRLARRPVDDPHGRVHGLGRDHRARPAARHGARHRARRRDAGRLPARHVRARRADAPDPAPGRARARGRVARRAGRGHPDRVLVGGARRLARARRVPLRLVLQRSRPARRREAARRRAPTATSSSSATRASPAAACSS